MPLIIVYSVLIFVSKIFLAPRSFAPPMRERVPAMPYVQPRFSTPTFVAPTAPVGPGATVPYPPPDEFYPAYPNSRYDRDPDHPGVKIDRHERTTR